MKKYVVAILSFLFISHLTFGQAGGTSCSNAVTLTCGQTIGGSTLGVLPDNFDSGNFEGTAGQLWYTFTPLGSGTVEVSLCNNNTNYDTRVHAYSGACGNLTFIAEDDDACVNPVFASDLIFPVAAGVTYFVRVGGSFTNAGTYEGTFSCSLSILGCTNPLSCNFNPVANTNDGSCDFASCYGCKYANALNYDATATFDDGSCLFAAVIPGCTNSAASNYNATATVDNGTCLYAGCTNASAYNFNPIANVDDGSCDLIGTCFGDMNQDGVITIEDVMLFIATFGTNCN